MSMSPIQPSVTPYIPPTVSTRIGQPLKQAGMPTNPMHQLLQNNPLLRRHPRLARDAKQLMQLKQRLLRSGRRRGPRRGRRSRRRRLQSRLGRLTARFMRNLQRMMHRHQKHGCGATGDKSTDLGFMNDPNLSMNDKVELFLMNLIKKSENQMQQLMDKHNQSGSKAGSKAKGLFKKIGTAIAGIVGGPAGAMAANAVFSAADSASGGGKSSDTEGDERMLMFKLQKIKSKMEQMTSLVSRWQKGQDDTLKGIIANL